MICGINKQNKDLKPVCNIYWLANLQLRYMPSHNACYVPLMLKWTFFVLASSWKCSFALFCPRITHKVPSVGIYLPFSPVCASIIILSSIPGDLIEVPNSIRTCVLDGYIACNWSQLWSFSECHEGNVLYFSCILTGCNLGTLPKELI